jgi:protease-4
VAQALNEAAADKNFKAIILRIDSPGGSPSASEIINRAIVLAKAKKPVVVSMGNLAASGGYWIAAPATAIVAQPATITGSIGVFGGKISLQGLWQS